MARAGVVPVEKVTARIATRPSVKATREGNRLTCRTRCWVHLDFVRRRRSVGSESNGLREEKAQRKPKANVHVRLLLVVFCLPND